jgi:DNA-binding transcriptional LysR family regulator
MEFRLLKAFVAAADAGNFSRAAETLHMSQSTLSKQIGALEASVGGRLFERGRHGADLTVFGQTFLADARALVRDADDVLARARQASSGRRGHLRVGLCLSVLSLVPRLVADFRREHPDVAITVTDLSSAEQTRRLIAGSLDAGFLRLPAAAGLSSLPVIDERLALAVPARSDYRRLPRDLSVLNEVGFVALTRSRGPGLAAQIERWCGEHRFVPHVTHEAEDTQSVLTSVAAGVGFAFIPSHAQHLLRDAAVLPLPGRHATWRIGLAWSSKREDPVCERFIGYMADALSQPRQRQRNK